MWKKYNLEPQTIYFWKLGSREFWIRKMHKEWQIATKLDKDKPEEVVIGKTVEEPEEAEWKSFMGDKTSTLNIVPALPDRSVVVKPQNDLKLLPRMTVQLFVHIPVWIQLYSGSAKNENLIFECASEELSGTWFGEPDNGMLSYSLPKAIHTSFDKKRLMPHEAACSVKIHNDSSSILDIQRLSLHVDSINIYGAEGVLLLNEVKVKFKGENVISDIHYSSQAPSLVENAKHLAPPRNQDKNSVLKKSFHFIKSLTDY